MIVEFDLEFPLCIRIPRCPQSERIQLNNLKQNAYFNVACGP